MQRALIKQSIYNSHPELAKSMPKELKRLRDDPAVESF